MIFTKLIVDKFRHIENVTLELGNVLTAIAGQNGTGKSTLLGWIAQACDSKLPNKTLLNSPYKSKYSEIFRFCPLQDYQYNYEVALSYLENGIEETKKMSTRLIETEDRYRVDFDGRGTAIDYPVIYLGLKRLIPLATEKSISLQETELSKTEQSQFANLSKEILFLTREVIKSEFVKSTNKNMVAMKTETYGHLGNSAGQDNLGQIISSIISFKKLKEDLKDNYKGGLLLIDEIDATLYAGSQVKLIERLYSLAKSLNIQIIFTTHSIEILDFISKKVGDESKINFLKWNNKKVINEVNPNIDKIINIIKVQAGIAKKTDKIQLICEDEVAELWSKNLILSTAFKGEINVTKGPFPEGTLVEMANSKHPVFKNVKYILDGDCKKLHKSKLPPKTAYLPGFEKPEKVMFDFIFDLDDNDSFWDLENNFTHQTCFGNFTSKNHKNWFQNETNQRYFGRGCNRLFNRWKIDNLEEVNSFLLSLQNAIR